MLKIKLDEGPEICHFPAGPSGPTVVHTNPNYGGLPQDNPDNSGIEAKPCMHAWRIVTKP